MVSTLPTQLSRYFRESLLCSKEEKSSILLFGLWAANHYSCYRSRGKAFEDHSENCRLHGAEPGRRRDDFSQLLNFKGYSFRNSTLIWALLVHSVSFASLDSSHSPAILFDFVGILYAHREYLWYVCSFALSALCHHMCHHIQLDVKCVRVVSCVSDAVIWLITFNHYC